MLVCGLLDYIPDYYVISYRYLYGRLMNHWRPVVHRSREACFADVGSTSTVADFHRGRFDFLLGRFDSLGGRVDFHVRRFDFRVGRFDLDTSAVGRFD